MKTNTDARSRWEEVPKKYRALFHNVRALTRRVESLRATVLQTLSRGFELTREDEADGRYGGYIDGKSIVSINAHVQADGRHVTATLDHDEFFQLAAGEAALAFALASPECKKAEELCADLFEEVLAELEAERRAKRELLQAHERAESDLAAARKAAADKLAKDPGVAAAREALEKAAAALPPRPIPERPLLQPSRPNMMTRDIAAGWEIWALWHEKYDPKVKAWERYFEWHEKNDPTNAQYLARLNSKTG